MRGPACKQCIYHLGRRGLFPDELAILQGEEIHPDDIVKWANEAGKVELKPKKLFGGLFDNMQGGK